MEFNDIDLSNLTRKEKDILEFLLDEYDLLKTEISEEHLDPNHFVINYKDQTGYILKEVQRILKG